MRTKSVLVVVGLVLGGLVRSPTRAHAQDWTARLWQFARNCGTIDGVSRQVVFAYGLDVASNQAYVFRTTDGGETWDKFPWPTWAIYDLSAVDSNRVWAACVDSRIYHSEDGGRTWSVQYDGTADSTAQEFDYIEMFDPLNGIAAGDPPRGKGKPLPILRTRDGGVHWTRVNDTFFVDAHLSALWFCIDFVNPQVGYYREAYYEVPLRNFRLHKTTDGGVTWRPTPLRSDQFLLVRFYDENLGLAVWKGNTPVYRTTDGGQTWDSYPQSLGDGWFGDVEFVPGDPSRVVAAVHDTLFFSADTGRTWTRLFAPGTVIRDIDLPDSTTAWVGCDHGILQLTRSYSGPTGVKAQTVPQQYLLLPASPNPFSRSTTIRLRLPHTLRVTVEVFDVRGRRVVTLAKGVWLGPGRHSFVFDGSDLPAGVYLVRLVASKRSAVQRVVLLK